MKNNPSRREFLASTTKAGITVGLVGTAFSDLLAHTAQPVVVTGFTQTPLPLAQDLKVNSERLQKSLSTLASYGKNKAGGSDRIAYSIHDIAARPFIKQLLADAGLEVSVDHAGNIIGRKAGKNPTLKPISMGSHIDEVPNGGDYDGPVGVLGTLEVVRTLQEAGIQTEHPLEVIVFTNEEGGVIGSRALVGG
jgi:N-carbamoyl-L-amino-acid hydrolase